LYGTSDGLFRMNPSIQNTAVHLVTGTRRCDHITPVLRQLHWLPVRGRVDYKVACLMHSVFVGLTVGQTFRLSLYYTRLLHLSSACLAVVQCQQLCMILCAGSSVHIETPPNCVSWHISVIHLVWPAIFIGTSGRVWSNDKPVSMRSSNFNDFRFAEDYSFSDSYTVWWRVYDSFVSINCAFEISVYYYVLIFSSSVLRSQIVGCPGTQSFQLYAKVSF